MCTNVLYACMSVRHVQAWYLRRLEQGFGSLVLEFQRVKFLKNIVIVLFILLLVSYQCLSEDSGPFAPSGERKSPGGQESPKTDTGSSYRGMCVSWKFASLRLLSSTNCVSK